MNMQHLTWADIQTEVERLTRRLTGMSNGITHVYGIPQGGVPVALLVAQATGLVITDIPTPGKTLIVDDLVDTGTTMRTYREQGYLCDALYRKPYSPQDLAPEATQVDAWLAFPWERDDGDPTDAVVRLLQHIGEDPTRDGLRDTPKRVVKALRELTEGYSKDPAAILSTTFDVSFDEMIVLTGVNYTSLCEHHMLPFSGTATIGYIPKPSGRVVGLSKLARLLDCYAQRLQVQERLTNQIAQAMQHYLDPLGVGVVIRGNHSCMCARGIRKNGEMITSSLLGEMRDDGVARSEFLALARHC
jgi:GTP cyclohydrolase IA